MIVALSKLDLLSIEKGSPTRPTTFEHRTSLFIMLSTIVVFSMFPVAVIETLTFVIGCSLLSGTTSSVCWFFSLLSIMPLLSVSCLFGSKLNFSSSSSSSSSPSVSLLIGSVLYLLTSSPSLSVSLSVSSLFGSVLSSISLLLVSPSLSLSASASETPSVTESYLVGSVFVM